MLNRCFAKKAVLNNNFAGVYWKELNIALFEKGVIDMHACLKFRKPKNENNIFKCNVSLEYRLNFRKAVAWVKTTNL